MSFYVIVYADTDESVSHVQCSDLPIENPAIQDETLSKFSAVVSGEYCPSSDIFPIVSVENGSVLIEGHTIESQSRMK